VAHCLPSSDDEIDKHLIHLKTSFNRRKILSITKIFIIKALHEILTESICSKLSTIVEAMDREIHEEFGENVAEKCSRSEWKEIWKIKKNFPLLVFASQWIFI
jgi:hypothetical protein